MGSIDVLTPLLPYYYTYPYHTFPSQPYTTRIPLQVPVLPGQGVPQGRVGVYRGVQGIVWQVWTGSQHLYPPVPTYTIYTPISPPTGSTSLSRYISVDPGSQYYYRYSEGRYVQLVWMYYGILMCPHLVRYPCPTSIGVLWNTGVILGSLICTQLYTGILLGIYYTPGIYTAYYSIIHIYREVYYGSMYRLLHSSGASMVFLL